MNEFCETTDYHNCPSATDEERLVNAFVSSMPGTPFHNCRQGCEHVASKTRAIGISSQW